jgi:hypothetical protein
VERLYDDATAPAGHQHAEKENAAAHAGPHTHDE